MKGKLKSIKNQYSKNILQFFDMTTLHGFRYISEKNRSLLEKIFWLLAIVSAHYFCGIVISQLIYKWNTSPVILTLDTKPLSIAEIPFPAITICNDDQIRATVFPFEERLNLKEYLNATEKMKIAAAQLLCGSYFIGDEDYVDKSIFRSIVKETTPQLKETVETAYYLQDISNSLINDFQPLFTPCGLCYTFNIMPFSHLLNNNFNNVLQELDNPFMLEVSEERLWDMDNGYQPGITGGTYPTRLSDRTGNSVVFTLKYNETEHDNTCTKGSTGFTIYVHSPVELPVEYHSIIHVEPGTKTDVYITPNIINTQPGLNKWTPYERGCYFSHEKPLIFFKIYTQFNCDSECTSLTELSACGCVMFYHPRNSTTPICGPNKKICLQNIFNTSYHQTNVKCDCLPSCLFIDYEIDYQYKPYIRKEKETSSFITPLSITNENETEYTRLSFSYKVKSVYATKRAALLTISDFIAQIGGTLSLFLGFSFLSLFEIIYYLTIRIFVNYWNKRKRNSAVHIERKIQVEELRLKNQPSSTIYF